MNRVEPPLNRIPLPFRDRVIRALDACPPGVATRILSNVRGAPVIFGLKIILPYANTLSITHIGYLTGQIFDSRSLAAQRGSDLQILLVDEFRESVRPYDQNDLRPAWGRILLCAVGRDAELALGALAIAELSWPQAESRFDLDGAPVSENENSTFAARDAVAGTGT